MNEVIVKNGSFQSPQVIHISAIIDIGMTYPDERVEFSYYTFTFIQKFQALQNTKRASQRHKKQPTSLSTSYVAHPYNVFPTA